MHRILSFFSLLLACQNLQAQDAADSSRNQWLTPPTIQFSAFADVFYAYDFGKPQQEARQVFFCNHNRHNEFNLNLALLRLSAQSEKWRTNIGLHAGTYVQDNYANEPIALRYISEANVGLSLNKKIRSGLMRAFCPRILALSRLFRLIISILPALYLPKIRLIFLQVHALLMPSTQN